MEVVDDFAGAFGGRRQVARCLWCSLVGFEFSHKSAMIGNSTISNSLDVK